MIYTTYIRIPIRFPKSNCEYCKLILLNKTHLKSSYIFHRVPVNIFMFDHMLLLHIINKKITSSCCLHWKFASSHSAAATTTKPKKIIITTRSREHAKKEQQWNKTKFKTEISLLLNVFLFRNLFCSECVVCVRCMFSILSFGERQQFLLTHTSACSRLSLWQ